MQGKEGGYDNGVVQFVNHLFFALAAEVKRSDKRKELMVGIDPNPTVLPISRLGFQRILHAKFPERYDGVNESRIKGGGQSLPTYCSYFNNGRHKMGYGRVAVGKERIRAGKVDLLTPDEAVLLAERFTADGSRTIKMNRADRDRADDEQLTTFDTITPSPIDDQDCESSFPERSLINTYRILRDTELARRVKLDYDFECQICGHTIKLPDGRRYAEAHHIRPLCRNGPDDVSNILCLCPNHHAELDYGVRTIALTDLRILDGHVIDESYIAYHNRFVHRA